MLPIIAKVGFMLPGSTIAPETLVFLSVLMCSGAMAFPISSFPNVNSLLAEDEFGKPYLKASDFIKMGFLATMIVVVSLMTWMVPYTGMVI
jgi:phosphate transporter